MIYTSIFRVVLSGLMIPYYSKKIPTLGKHSVQNKCWLSGLELTKFLSENQAGKTQIRLLLQKQSDLGLPCFSMLLWQATTVQEMNT